MSEPIGQLIIRQPDNTVRRFAIVAERILIGRNPDNALQLDNPLVSRQHAELRVEPQGLIITDLGSSNGTFVGGERLLPNQPRLLEPRVLVQIGPFAMVFQPAEQAPAHATQEVRPDGASESQEPHDSAAPAILEEQPVRPEHGEAPGGTAVLDRPALLPARHWDERPAAERRLLSRDQRSRYMSNLPIIYQDNEFLNRYLLIFESIWEPLEQREDYIEMYFDPRTCPVSFLPWLANWLGMSLNQRWPEARRRHLLSQALELYRWRGTRHGLTRMIEVCTGLTPEIVEDPGEPFLFRVRVPAPSDGAVDWALIETLVITHKPAHAGYILEKPS